MRYFFHIGYLGTHYSGWQKHPDGLSVQQVLENNLSQVLKIPKFINGCGRTDAQVHASQFFFHLDTDVVWDFDLQFRLNKTLPDDIAIFGIIPVDNAAHARFDAVERTYDYFIHTSKDPFLSGFSSYYPITSFNTEAMKKAAKLLLIYSDYHAFCKMPDRNDHTICNISAADIYMNGAGDRLRFNIAANRFLGRMMRIIIGKLLNIGTGQLTVDQFEHYLINPQLTQIIKPAHPQGLYLSKIKYPYLDVPPHTHFTKMLAGDDGDWRRL